jgi:hypothetical protein
VLQRDCPPVITDAIAAGIWGDDLHPCEGTDHDNGTAAPAETVRQRNATIAAHKKKADKRLKKALVLLKSKGDF